MKKPLLPLAFVHGFKEKDPAVTILAGDVGGTKTNMALYRVSASGVTLLREGRYASQEYTSLADIIINFTGKEWPDRICVAVAGPVTDGKVKLTNLSWQLDSQAMSTALKVPVAFINDLEANGYGLAGLQSNELAAIHTSDTKAGGNIAIIAPGTGLGEAGLYFDGKKYHPFATEGGHCDFAPRNEQDIALLKFLLEKHGRVSWERILSGNGIYTLWEYLTEVENKPKPAWLLEEMETNDKPATVSKAAIDKRCEVCMEAMDMFNRYLAIEGANIILKMKATGGLYLAGGIAVKNISLLRPEVWTESFDNSGRMKALLAQVPVFVMKNEKAPLLGSAYFAAFNM